MIYLKKVLIIIFMVSIILINSLLGSAAYAEELPQFYNIDLKKAYYEMDDKEIEEVISEYEVGNKFAKFVNGKLVDYSDYRNKVIAVIIPAMSNNLSPVEIAMEIASHMPSIIASLPPVEVESNDQPPIEYEFYVMDIY